MLLGNGPQAVATNDVVDRQIFDAGRTREFVGDLARWLLPDE
jgi:hypothetical protein